MTKTIIDGSAIRTIDQLHEFLKREWNLPRYYGKNLDALWDCITAWVKLPIRIAWKDIEESKKNWGEKFVDDLLNLFEDAKRELGDDFDFRVITG